MELTCGLDERLPIGEAFVRVILGQFDADLLQLCIKCHHHLPELWDVSDFISELYQFFLYFFQQQVGKERRRIIVTLDDLYSQVKAPVTLWVLFDKFFLEGLWFVKRGLFLLAVCGITFAWFVRVFLF